MTQREFRNGLCQLRFIDMSEFVAAGGPATEWPAFRDNPWAWFIKAPDDIAENLWNLIQERTTTP